MIIFSRQLNAVFNTFFLTVFLSFTLAGCSDTAKEPAAGVNSLSIQNAYVRAVPPGQSMSAAFMQIQNKSDQDRALLKASSDVAESVELHEHVHEGGMMQMRQVEKIMIAANSSRELKPGGYHVMLIGLTRPIQLDDNINIALTFDDGSVQEITAPVKKIEHSMKM